MLVNDRSVSVLENYDFEVIRTQKSRNAILCETNKGWYILKEYKGPVFRLEMMAKVLEGVRQNGFTRAEQLLSTKEGALFCCDQEQNRCIVKSWPQGRECSLKDGQECRDAMRTLAVLHSALHFPQPVSYTHLAVYKRQGVARGEIPIEPGDSWFSSK